MAIAVITEDRRFRRQIPALVRWTKTIIAPLLGPRQQATILYTDAAQMQQLNQQYRGKDAPTNVLSFPCAEMIDDVAYLGDIAVGFEVLVAEAEAQQKPFASHVAHMLTHGVLHLQGYRHDTPGEAEKMEGREIAHLKIFDIVNPYQIH